MRIRNLSETAIPPRWLIASLLAVGILLSVYTIVRAVRIEMTIDELHSLEHYANTFQLYPEQYGIWSANHHWLNSLSMRCSLILFGDSPLSLRLPNLIAHILFLWFTARITLRLRDDIFAVALFAFLNAHPYMLDFFSLARGYGLMLGTMAGSIYYLLCFVEKKKTKLLVYSLLFGSFSVLSNFVMLNFFFVVLAIIFIAFFADKELRTKSNFIFVLVFPVGLLTLVLPHISQLQSNDSLDFGFTSLWSQTIAGLCWGMLYDAPYAGENSFASSQLPIVVLFVAVLVSGVMLVRKYKLQGYLTSFHGIALQLLIGVIVLMLLQYYALDSRYPPARSSLFLFFFFLLAIAASIQFVRVNEMVRKTLLLVFTVLVVLHFFTCFNLRGVYEWKQASGSRDAIAIIVKERAQINGTGEVVLISGNISGPSLRWLADQQELNWLRIIEHGSEEQPPNGDYYFEEVQFTPFHSTNDWVLLNDDPFAHNKLYKAK